MKTASLLLLLLLSIPGCGNDTPKAQPPNETPAQPAASVPQFDRASAFGYLKAQTDMGPRSPNTPAHQKCLDYLHLELQKYADVVSLQPFTVIGYKNEVLKLNNVVASFRPSARTRILLLAHWDTRPRADQDQDPKKRSRPILGANDGASGVAILLEMARQMKSNPPPLGVDLVLVDGEDYGLEADTKYYFLGARYLAKHYPAQVLPVFGILLDMVGDKELDLMKEPMSMQYAPDIVDFIWKTADELGVTQFSSAVQQKVLDDHLPLNEAGIRTVDLIDFQYPDQSNRYWHTTEDTPDKCSPESLAAVGSVLLQVLYTYQQ